MIRLRTLGALDLRSSDGAELRAVLAQPRRVALLAYLALAAPRGPHQRDALLALFWPERDDGSARNALNQALHFLRRNLGADAFVARGSSEVGLAGEQLWCDAVAFDSLLDIGRPADALELYQGELLDGFHIGDAPEFQRWQESERSRLAGRYMQAIEVVAEQREAAGDFNGAIARWRRLAARDPLCSRIALRLMRALAAGGNPAAAVQHSRVHAMLLREELNLGLAPEVAALVRQLQSSRAGEPITGAEASPRASTPPSDDVAQPAATPAPTGHHGERGRWRRGATLAVACLVSLSVFGQRAGSRESDATYLRALYLSGQQAESSRSLDGLQTARAAYELALDRDPTFAPAYAGLSAVHTFMAHYDYAPRAPALDSARMMALRAVALDSTLPETRTARAVTLGNAGEFDAAEREFGRAIELGPNSARAHYWYSVLLVALGRGEHALREVTRAGKLDPLPPRGLTAMRRYAEWLVTGKRPYLDSAVTGRRPILMLEPGEPWARAREATELAHVGRCVEARTEIEHASQLAPVNNFRMLTPVAEVHWWCGEQARARQALAEMKQLPGVEERGYHVAILHVLFGEPDSAFAWLPRQRWTLSELSGLSADQDLDPVRADPRFAALLRKIGIRQPAR